MPIIRGYFLQLTQDVLADPSRSDDKYRDHNAIMRKLVVSSLYNIIKLALHIWIVTYMVAMSWMILIKYASTYWFVNEKEVTFLSKWGL